MLIETKAIWAQLAERIRHRDEILGSEVCGCFYCPAVFPPSKIKEWVDTKDGIGQTALCPKCDIDSVIGSNSGLKTSNRNV
jgi:hypothetical protein